MRGQQRHPVGSASSQWGRHAGEVGPPQLGWPLLGHLCMEGLGLRPGLPPTLSWPKKLDRRTRRTPRTPHPGVRQGQRVRVVTGHGQRVRVVTASLTLCSSRHCRAPPPSAAAACPQWFPGLSPQSLLSLCAVFFSLGILAGDTEGGAPHVSTATAWLAPSHLCRFWGAELWKQSTEGRCPQLYTSGVPHPGEAPPRGCPPGP